MLAKFSTDFTVSLKLPQIPPTTIVQPELSNDASLISPLLTHDVN